MKKTHINIIFLYLILLIVLQGIGITLTNAQIPSADLELLKLHSQNISLTIQQKTNPKRNFLIQKGDPLIQKINPINYIFAGLLYFYQTSLSQQFSADCLYSPTCSSFSKDVISHYGLIKGIILTADRLSRCNRIAQTSLHPLTINEHNHRSEDSYLRYRTLKQTGESDPCLSH
jgi:putative membrane protein insertion efficiency factor